MLFRSGDDDGDGDDFDGGGELEDREPFELEEEESCKSEDDLEPPEPGDGGDGLDESSSLPSKEEPRDLDELFGGGALEPSD